jgi:phosphoribosylformylglycinamidine synthase
MKGSDPMPTKTIFFQQGEILYAVLFRDGFTKNLIDRIRWFLEAEFLLGTSQTGNFLGYRVAIETPWSVNAVSAINDPNVLRIEKYRKVLPDTDFDPMTQEILTSIGQTTFTQHTPSRLFRDIKDIQAFDEEFGLSLSSDMVQYLNGLAEQYKRPLTDCEIFAFAQVNSEHCRHHKFNGTFIIDGVTMPMTLFSLIQMTFSRNPNTVVSAYVDNATAFGGSPVKVLGYSGQDTRILSSHSYYMHNTLKAETHNHPTTVCASPGAATGAGGEIRDRMAVGRGSVPLAGGAVYCVSDLRLYPPIVGNMPKRDWLYQSPVEILIKATDGAGHYGNMIGQPLINGAVLSFEHEQNGIKYGYDKVIMLASGIGSVRSDYLEKGEIKPGMLVVILGGKNYRIGLGGGSASSVDLSSEGNTIDLSSVQRSDPTMQRKVLETMRHFCLTNFDYNPFISTHDLGAGGNFTATSEVLRDANGGEIYLDALPLGNTSLTHMELMCNESQERMLVVIREEDLSLLEQVALREDCPFYVVGRTTGDSRITFHDRRTGAKPFDMSVVDLFGKLPKIVITDSAVEHHFSPFAYDSQEPVSDYLRMVLLLPDVGSKSYLTSKLDRSVGGLIAQQQCVGPLQVPVADYGLTKKGFFSHSGIAISKGLAPIPSLINPVRGIKMAMVEALTNIVFSGVRYLSDVILSANWMWPCGNPGEDARLYEAVRAASRSATQLGINIPTGKDSLSMTQKYPDGEKVIAPGTVIFTASAEVPDIRRRITPELQLGFPDTQIIHIDWSKDKIRLGGTSFAYSLNQIGDDIPDINLDHVKKCFEAVSHLVVNGLVLAGHDIGGGGRIVTLLEMGFAAGFPLYFDADGSIEWLFAENPGVIMQVRPAALRYLDEIGLEYSVLPISLESSLEECDQLSINSHFSDWSETSMRLEEHQNSTNCVSALRSNLGRQPLIYRFPESFTGKQAITPISVIAAVIRDEGANGREEMQHALHLAGFDVKDITMTDLISGRETLEDIRVIAFAGGFTHSDAFGPAKGWAGKLEFNKTAKNALERFFDRPDTLSLGVGGGCHLMVRLGIFGSDAMAPKILPNSSGRFESAFINVDIPPSLSDSEVWLKDLRDSRLAAWFAHSDGKFDFGEDNYGHLYKKLRIAATYSYGSYPANPSGGNHPTAAIETPDGRHLAMMIHPERSLFPENWGYYPPERRATDEVSPWMQLFQNAADWCRANP